MVRNFVRIILKNNIRIYLSDLTDVVNEIFNYHNYKPLPNLILANSIVSFAPLIFLYDSNKNMIRLKTNGAIKSLIFESKENNIRILISNPNIETEYDQSKYNTIPLILGIGDDGIFEFSREIKNKIFKSEVKLAKSDIVTDLAYYLNKSDQIYSAIKNDVWLDEKDPSKVVRAKSVIFQMLPEHTEEDIQWVENFISKTCFDELSILDYEDLIQGQLLEIKQIYASCWCSREKVINAINLLSSQEIQELFNNGPIETKCEFCNHKYEIKKEEIISE